MGQINTLKREVGHLQTVLSEKNKKIDELSREVSSWKVKLGVSAQQIEKLQGEIKMLKNPSEKKEEAPAEASV